MNFKIPIKRSALYTEQISLKVEKDLKDKIIFLSNITGANKPDVPEIIRIGIRDAIEKAFQMYAPTDHDDAA